MELQESELKYTLHLLNGLTEEIFDEVLQVYYDVADKKNVAKFSDNVLSFFKDNLQQNPVTTSTILTSFQNSMQNSDQNLNEIQNIYIEILKKKVTDITKTEEFISLLSQLRFDDGFLQNFTDEIIEKISEDQFRHYKKELFVSLITLGRPQVLTDFSNRFNKIGKLKLNEFTFCADYMLTLCYVHNQHWLIKALETYKYQLEDVKRVNFEMNKFTKQVLMLITIDIVNCIETSDLSHVFTQLENILSILNSYSSTDKQLEFYITEIFRAFNVLKFCLENNNCKTISMSYFNQSLIQSALSIISQYCVLSNIDRYKMSRLLSINNDTLSKLKVLNGEAGGDAGKSSHWDITVYNSYCIITMVLDFIVKSNKSPNEEKNILDEVKLLVHGLNPISYQIEIIENIYVCLFLRYEYYSCNEYDQTCSAHSDCSYFVLKKNVKCPHGKNESNVGFICNAQTTQAILTTLKEIISKVENEISSEDLNENGTRLKYISKLVNDSLWKLQLVSNLSPDQNSVAPLKICMDYADFGDSSDDEPEKDIRISRKKPRLKKRYSNPKSDNEPVGSSQMSSSVDGPWWVSRDTDFTSLLLASPGSLVALALHHNHFTKANEIIEMFDLSDTEIAAEVNFIEQYKQLVIKINNILCSDTVQNYPIKELTSFSLIPAGVVSLVEGFLASQRSPNYHDVVELARRYPDLQLYDPRNANLINAIDLLLSTGVTREVTYGLINIIERKLTDVQVPREIGTKKNNYIQFIKDAISIMFEIFGNCETTSPMYVDNMCSVVADCRVPLKHKDFTNLNQYSKELTKYYEDLAETLDVTSPTDENYNFQKCHQMYLNVVSISDKDLCSILETYPGLKKKPRTHYLRACYIYVKNISQMEIDSDKQLSPDLQSDRTYFCVLNKHLNNLISELINDKALPITSLEPICKKLGINLVHKLLLNYCPPIQVKNVQVEPNEDSFNSLLQMVYAFHDAEEEMFIEHTDNFCPLPRPLDPAVTSYIILQNWVIANLIEKIHSASQSNSQLQQSVDFRTRYLNNYMDLERFNFLKVVFGGNKTIASLQSCINLNDLFKFMMKLVKSGKLGKCIEIVDALSESQLLQNSNLLNLRDFLLFKLAVNSRIENCWKYTYHLKCTELRIDLVLNNLSSWPAEGALEALDVLRHTIDIASVDDTVVTKCKNWMKSIPVYQQIAETSSMGSWFDVYEKSINDPKNVVETLMDNQQFELCLNWTNFHEISNNMKSLIISSLLLQLFEYTSQTNAEEIRTLLKELPIHQAVELVHKNVHKVHNLEILQEIMIFINENSSNSKLFENIKIGLLIMSEIDLNIRNLFWDIIDKPLLIIEQYLMNAKLDKLAMIISKISPSLINDPAGDNLYYNIKIIDSIIISTNSVDALLRVYAEKALDMRCAARTGGAASRKINEALFLQSIDSINFMGKNGPFVMPEQVPSKEQWVRDEQAERCMLCHLSIFSMLIRRHHCRRCGRLVCYTCSRHRMQVASYAEGVQVRVCNDCYTQTTSGKSSTDGDKATLLSSSGSGCDSSVASMEWCLGVNANRNNDLRREFSYEFTPNVMLCLTIMKMHSLNLDYPRFLLDRSEEMGAALSAGGAAPRLLLRARRALLLAASEIYSRFPSEDSRSSLAEAGAAHTARRLAHAGSLALLIKHGCHHLAPPDDALPGQYVRRLLEAEKWELALEIATKSGVPRNSVLAAWGKACLKAGCFKQAREKFSHCFRNVVTVHSINVEPPPEDCEFGKEANEASPFAAKNMLSKIRNLDRWSSTSSLQSDGVRPKQNPPLLNEIISILENVNFPVKAELRKKAEQMQISNEKLSTTQGCKQAQEPALTIMHAFASVERIKHGDYSHFQVTNAQKKNKSLGLPQTLLRRQSTVTEPKNNEPINKLDPFFFNECVYYLSNYGSHIGNMAFYLKNGSIGDALKYCHDNVVEKEVFTEAVYMECLKKKQVAELIKCMQDMDSTWEMWSDYLTHTCRTLESSGQLQALYWLQTATGEQARAGATCAKMYATSAPATHVYATLRQRQHYLVSARAHLMQCVPTSTQHNKNVPSNCHHLRMDSATIEKHINTVSRQMEVAKFLALCEDKNRINEKIMADIFPSDPPRQKTDTIRPLTLFGTQADKTKLVTLILVCGENILEGYPLAYRIMEDNKIDAWLVYSVCARVLVCNNRSLEVRELCLQVRETSASSSSEQSLSDRVLEAGVAALVRHCDARGQLFDEQAELLIADIQNVAIKISSYMECRILAAAYILAVQHGRLNDLRRIQREAERLGQDQVRHACNKRLATAAHSML